MILEAVDDPSGIAELFETDRRTHIYGLADLEEPFWSHSTWYRRGDAVVGAVSTGDEWCAGYAMSSSASSATLDLVEEVVFALPAATLLTGPPGLSTRLGKHRRVRELGPHVRMILENPASLESDERVVRLADRDIGAIEALNATDPGASFFLPGMVGRGVWVGIRHGPELVAVAGTHVLSRRHGVAAVGGVMTAPSQRGRGLGATVTATLCCFLSDVVPTIGLNVASANTSARALYARLGFRDHLEYEEAELI